MQQRLPSLADEPIAFAHRGARAYAPENTLEAFALAVRLGATGLESDVWLTADGVAVLDHDGVVPRRWGRRRALADVLRDDLPPHIPTLAEVVRAHGSTCHLSFDLKDPAAGPEVVRTLLEHAPGSLERTWLCAPDIETLLALRGSGVRLVDSTRLSRIGEGIERRAARLAAEGIDGLNLHHSDWSGGLVALVHRFGVHAFGWDLQEPHILERGLRMGLDAVYSDRPDVMMDVYRDQIGRPTRPD
ncbi:MAG: glycerophosphodiester phosphodiesterase [Ilumatobacteraceae bacterium]